MKHPADIIGKEGLTEDQVVDYLVEVEVIAPPVPGASGFLRIMETLTRIGIQTTGPSGQKVLNQTCHILNKGGRYYIVHFKHMFLLDGRENGLLLGDIARMNRIVQLLAEWNMIRVVNPEQVKEPSCSLHTIKIIPANQRKDWVLQRKYRFGRQSLKENPQ